MHKIGLQDTYTPAHTPHNSKTYKDLTLPAYPDSIRELGLLKFIVPEC